MKTIRKGLKAIGLTELEAKIYLKLLEMKKSGITKLADEVKVTRTQLYPLLEKMTEKGFVRKVERSPAMYSVIEPEKMETLLGQWLANQTNLVEEVRNFLKKSQK